MWYGVSFEKWCGKDLGIGPQINPRIGLKAVQPGAARLCRFESSRVRTLNNQGNHHV
jgi:hypothetical protein